MRRILLLVLVTSSALMLGGCGADPPLAPPKPFTAPKPAKRTALEAKGNDGVLRGKVVYDGEPPASPFITRINDHPDKAGCLQGGPAETRVQTWMVDPKTNSVANVVVWLEPPSGKYFALRDQDKDRAGQLVVIDQPHCAFVPHVVALFPSYFDGGKQVKTGQRLQVKNSAPFPHSIQWGSTRENEGQRATIAPNGGHLEFVLNPEKSGLPIGCGVHNWMHGTVWIFEHPFHAVTRDDGSFQFDHVPTGVELTFKAWHETRAEPFEKRLIMLKAGENPPLELKIKQ